MNLKQTLFKACALFLKQNPLRVLCKAKGKVVPVTVVDHIILYRGDQRLFWTGITAIRNHSAGDAMIRRLEADYDVIQAQLGFLHKEESLP